MKSKRDKRSRIRGRKTCGFGSRKKHRGSGHQGGVGMAGTGKRADHRKTWILKYMPDYFGKTGFKSHKKRLDVINIEEIEKRIETLVKDGKAKKTQQGIEINLGDYKVLGSGNIKSKLIIKAASFSKSAKEKIEKAGGKAVASEKNTGKHEEKRAKEVKE